MRKQKISFFILAIFTFTFFTIFFSMNIFAEGFDDQNSPELMKGAGKFAEKKLDMEYNFKNLKLEARLKDEDMPWADTYWPTVKGGLTYDYQNDKVLKEGFLGAIFGKVDRYLKNLSKKIKLMADKKEKIDEKMIATLPPIIKFDIMRGDYNLTHTRAELARTKDRVDNPKGNEWEGLCDGWSAAASNIKEPQICDVVNPQGLPIKFGSSDVKALAIFYMSQLCNGETCFAGRRCDEKVSDAVKKREDFKDVNPGMLHMVLANLIGRGEQGFVMDRTIDLQVWNQPIFGYKSVVEKVDNNPSDSSRAPNTKKEVHVNTVVYWLTELEPSFEPNDNSPAAHKANRYTYILELDENDNIIGGRWTGTSIDNHPDFIWAQNIDDIKSNPAAIDSGWTELDDLLKKSKAL